MPRSTVVSEAVWRSLLAGYVLAACGCALLAVAGDVNGGGLAASFAFLGVLLVFLKTGGIGVGRLIVRYSERPVLFLVAFSTYLAAAVVFFVLALG